MKPVFSSDRTNGTKNIVYNEERFVTAKISDATSEKFWDAEEKRFDAKYDEQNIPRRIKYFKDFALLIGLGLLAIVYLVYTKVDEETFFKLSPIFTACFVGVYVLMFYGQKRLKNFKQENSETKEESEIDREYASAVSRILDEFMFPYDANPVDAIFFSYKAKNGPDFNLSKLSCYIHSLRVYKKDSTLYLTDLEQKLEIPVVEGAYIEKVNCNVKLNAFGMDSDRDFTDPKYNIEGVELVKYPSGGVSMIKCDSYGIYRFTYDGEEYGIYIANYDIPTFEEILNS